MQKNSVKAYKYYVKSSLISFLIQYLNGNKYRLTINFKGTGLKHYGCEKISAIVHPDTATRGGDVEVMFLRALHVTFCTRVPTFIIYVQQYIRNERRLNQ